MTAPRVADRVPAVTSALETWHDDEVLPVVWDTIEARPALAAWLEPVVGPS